MQIILFMLMWDTIIILKIPEKLEILLCKDNTAVHTKPDLKSNTLRIKWMLLELLLLAFIIAKT